MDNCLDDMVTAGRIRSIENWLQDQDLLLTGPDPQLYRFAVIPLFWIVTIVGINYCDLLLIVGLVPFNSKKHYHPTVDPQRLE